MDDNDPSPSTLVPLPTLKHADWLYFKDCRLIIQAEDVLFRVSGEFLATQSTFVRDMLAIPIPPDAETLDGCLIARIPESAADMTTFLKALMYPSFFEPSPAATSFDLIDPILRLSHKYDVDWLQKRALSHLAITHPTTHAGWTALRTNPNSFIRCASDDLCISVVILARELSLDWILPTAFYRLSRVKSPVPIFESAMLMEDKLRWAEAVRKLDGQYRSRALDFLWEPREITGCVNPDPRWCVDIRIDFRQGLDATRENSLGSYIIPLDVWGESSQAWTALASNSVCEVCIAEMKRLKQAADEAFWNDLPEIFGLGDWETLEKNKKDTFDDI
ncbi:hypothetical protein C8F01DRAFT_1037112 [Mycena amicta]|nr:hypothetical protein C8F01DRAFT_1037112 [Mycena amicta]